VCHGTLQWIHHEQLETRMGERQVILVLHFLTPQIHELERSSACVSYTSCYSSVHTQPKILAPSNGWHQRQWAPFRFKRQFSGSKMLLVSLKESEQYARQSSIRKPCQGIHVVCISGGVFVRARVYMFWFRVMVCKSTAYFPTDSCHLYSAAAEHNSPVCMPCDMFGPYCGALTLHLS
jgi:hypothetical protein